MADWNTVYTITTPGTTATAASSTTLTNSGASWPASNLLTNFTCRILTGTGAGSTGVITSNTTTVLTCSGGWSGTSPGVGSTYELVCLMKNNDTVTNNMTFSTNTIWEIQDSATIIVTAGQQITASGSCKVRLNKTAATMPTFQTLNRTTIGKNNSWSGIIITASTNTPSFSFIKILDSNPSLTLGATGQSLSNISNIWIEDGFGVNLSGTPTVDQIIKYIYIGYGDNLYFSGTATHVHTLIYDSCWIEQNAGISWVVNASGALVQWVRNCVFRNTQACLVANLTSASAIHRVNDCYFIGQNNSSMCFTISGGTFAATNATFNNVIMGGPMASATGIAAKMIFTSANNDCIGGSIVYRGQCATQSNGGYLQFSGATNWATSTSTYDFFSGTQNACAENIDTTALTTSNATPPAYANLTAARTNAQSVRNKLLTCNNIAVSGTTTSATTITFDCTNGAVAGQGSTVNVDSNSGQAVLSVAATTGFLVGMDVEIGYGTARSETGRVSSISAGTSITLEANLTFTHTAAQADTVYPVLRNWGMPFVRYGTSTGSYTMSTSYPDQIDWGKYFCLLKVVPAGMSWIWKKTGHSVALTGLSAGTTYYAQPCAWTPLGELCVGAEQTFSTSGGAAGTSGAAYV